VDEVKPFITICRNHSITSLELLHSTKNAMNIFWAAHTLSISIFLLASPQKGFPLQSLPQNPDPWMIGCGVIMIKN
jgi:hypothetical protein